MKTETPSFLYKQKFKKKLKKMMCREESTNLITNKKIKNYNKRISEIMAYFDTQQNKNKHNSVITKKQCEKSLIHKKKSFVTLKNSFNIINLEENIGLSNYFKEAKENISLNLLFRNVQSQKTKKVDISFNKYMHKRNLYHENSCIKKNNLKGIQYYNDSNSRQNLFPQINLGTKNRAVLKNLSTSNNKYYNNERKNNKIIKSFGIEINKNSFSKMINNNNSKNNIYNTNYTHNYSSQKKDILSNNFLYCKNFNLKDSLYIKDFSKENIFFYDDERQIQLTNEEKSIYGDRIMKGYSKIKLLGKGGYGIVWLCSKNIDRYGKGIKEYAIKQTCKKKNQESSHSLNNILANAKNEISTLNLLNNKKLGNNNNEINVSNNKNYDENNYCELIPKIYESYEDNNDIWFSFEKGGSSLSSLCFKIKGEFEKRERIYLIQKGQFVEYLFSNINQFKYLLRQLVIGINYINSKGIIHSDIKPENILIDYTKNIDFFKINSIKIIDYGSAFSFNEISFSNTSNTPEYLCPEITIGNKKFIKDLSNNKEYISSVDVWSLGITFLELCLCCPIWMNFKTKIAIKGKIIYTHGIFGCKMRDSNKIFQKQIEVSKNLKKILNNSLLYMFEKEDREKFIDLLGKMLSIDYNKRITGQDILKHPFLKESLLN